MNKTEIISLLEKAKSNISKEPDKCLIYLEKAIKEIRKG